MDLFFRKGTEHVAIRIINGELYFSKVQGYWVKYSGLEGLKFDVQGILKEFPDLEGKEDKEIKKEGVKRFREHIKSLKTEDEIVEYLKKDLIKYGYVLILIIKKGFRPIRCN